MKEFLPVLIGLVYFAVQIYFNYKKEQEKALKRNPGQATAENPEPSQAIKPTLKDLQRQKELQGQRELQRKTKKTAPRSPMPHADLPQKERYQTMKREVEIPEEVLRLRAFKEQKRQELLSKGLAQKESPIRKLSLEILDPEDHSTSPSAVNFDLEQAVIQSIILERKNY